jgi:demethylspheroidene O-methyltransferase
MAAQGWRERWLAFRNKTIAKPAFQHWAAGFLLTRRTARRQANALFDLVSGFVYSQILSAAVQLDLFQILEPGPQGVEALAARLGLEVAAAERLLKGCAALDLTERLADGRFGLGPLGAALLGNPALPPMIAHHALLYADLGDPVALLKGAPTSQKLKDYWAYAARPAPQTAGAGEVAAYSGLMAATQSLVAREILDAWPMARHRHLLDIGGGEGAFIKAAGARHAHLNFTLFDLPAVTARAHMALAEAGLTGRVKVENGSFLSDSLPQGADIATLVRVLHDHDDAAAASILRAARAALQPGGVLLIAEPMSEAPGARRMGDAYFGFYLAAMGSGRPRTPHEIKQMLRQAGFSSARLIATRQPLLVQVIAAT